jgi:hypothetical protein
MKPATLITAIVLTLGSAACVHETDNQPNIVRLDGDRHITVRAEAGRLWWSYYPWTEPHELCTLPARGQVDDLRVTPALSTDDGFVVTFRQGGTTWRGDIGTEHSHIELSAVSGPLTL